MSLVNSPQLEYSADGKPRERAGCGKLFTRVLIALVALVVLGLSAYLMFNATVAYQARHSGTVRGSVQDARQQPLPDAIVFIVAEPALRVVTRADGSFDLVNVPLGKQSLIVYYAKVGREIEITLDQNGLVETGVLTLDVER